MSDLFAVIQNAMKYQGANATVDITLDNGSKYTGVIEKFNGTVISVNGENISIKDVSVMEEHKELDYASFLMNRVKISLFDGVVIDAVLVEANSEEIKFITENGQDNRRIEDINFIECGENIVFLTHPAEASSSDKETAIQSDESDLAEKDDEPARNMKVDAGDKSAVLASEERSEETLASKEDVTDYDEKSPDESTDENHEPNLLEKYLIDGNKSAIGSLISQTMKLRSFGYSDKEIERIQKMYKSLTWGNDPYKIANRVYSIQLNKNGLARKLYEDALDKCSKGTPEYQKILNSLMQFYVDGDEEEYIRFWNKNAKYFKDNAAFCEKYIDVQIKSRGIQINVFERSLIDADKKTVIEYARNTEKLLELGYESEDIERIGKAYKNIGWDTGWYKTAARLFGMQLNKNGLAEIFYEAALLIVKTKKKSDEYTKILNALASIKMNEDANAYAVFFRKYRDKLKNNTSYCSVYANALLSKQNWVQLERDLPMLKEQLADNPAYLEKLENEISYYKSMPPFVLEENRILSERYSNDSVLYDQEKALIEKLPDRNALKALLEIYFFNREEEAYFALVDYALFYMKEEKNTILKLVTMLHETANVTYVINFLPRIPALWCDAELIRKYVSNNPSHDNDENKFIKHIRSIGGYKNLNQFELSIVNKDYDEVTRYISNPYLLEDMDYSDDEISEIISTDIETQFSDDIYTMRRVLAFQGNKNHTAERYLLEAYYDNKIDMCNRLFPLLLEEKRGELILAMFEFDGNLKNNMTSLRRFYYVALCMTEPNDEVFFGCLESEWMNYPEDEILDRMDRIAKEKGDNLLLKQIELQKNKPRGNEFETALINADSDTIRKFIKNANMLVELGYTPEEIQKINKIFGLGTMNARTKPGQIANRVYLYQKNKNNLAERLYLNALSEDTKEDALTDCKALFQIYTGQRNFEMVCKIYEEYLYVEMEEKFNKAYASTYCIALYEMDRYSDFVNYIRTNREKWDGFSLAPNLLYVSASLNTHEFDELIRENIEKSTSRPDIISRYVLLVTDKNPEEIYSERFADIFNIFFSVFSEDDIAKIVAKLKGIEANGLIMPKAGVIAAIVDENNKEKYIQDWLDYLWSEIDANRKIDTVIQLKNIFSDLKDMLTDKAMTLYLADEKEGVSDYKISALENFIYDGIENEESKKKWCDIQEEALCTGKGSLHSLENYLGAIDSLNRPESFWGVYLSYRKFHTEDLMPQKIFELIYAFYQMTKEKNSGARNREIAEELIGLSGEFSLDFISCKNLISICQETGKRFESKIYLIALEKLIQTDTEGEIFESEHVDEKSLDYTEFLMNALSDDTHIDFSKKCRGWSKYIVVSEEEKLTIERLRNTIKTAELWVKDEINILSKSIICEPLNAVNWKLFQTWVLQSNTNDGKIIGAILYQLSSQGSKEIESALYYAVKNDLKDIALELTLKLLDMHLSDFNISAQKNIRTMIEKGWFREESFKNNADLIIRKIGSNINLSDAEDYEWNSVCAAVDLAIETDKYVALANSVSEFLSRNCAKQCCVVISAMLLKGQTEDIGIFFDCLDSAMIEVPYKELVRDLYEISNTRDFSYAERIALECIQLDYGNTLGVNNLLDFYCRMCIVNQRKEGLETIDLLMNYTQYDPVLYEVSACFLKNEESLDGIKKYYDYMYEYLESNQSENPIEYAIGQMICGENYLRMSGKSDVKSFKKFIEERYPKYLDAVKNYQEFCDCITVGLRGSGSEEFTSVFLKALLTGDWISVFEYKAKDEIINSVIKNNIKTTRINVADDYYRSVIRGVALYVLKHSDDMWEIIDNSERIRLFWDNLGNAGCGFDYFSDILQHLSEEESKELISVFSLDIETLTIYKKFFGKYVLLQKHSSGFAKVFSVFINARSGDIFGNQETQNILKTFDKERAIEICQSYERLYIRASGPVQIYATGKAVIKDSDYESNVFSNFLRRNTGDYTTIEKRYERFKKKYDLICGMKIINSFEDANDNRFDLNEKRQIFSLRSLYYYYSVLSGSVDKNVFNGHQQAEIINAITIALSDDSYMFDVNDFVGKLDPGVRQALGVLLLVEQDKLDAAAQVAIEDIKDNWKAYLCARLVASYGKNGKVNGLCEQCIATSKRGSIKNSYWIKNFKHAKSINQIDADKYISIKTEVKLDEDAHAEEAVKGEPGVERPRNLKEEIVMPIELTDDSDVISFEVPSFISDFLSAQHDEKQLLDLQKEWKELRNDVDNGKEAQDTLNEYSIKIGITILKRSRGKIDEKIMSELFGLVTKYSIQDTYLITALHDILQSYITGYSDLDLLAASVYENRIAISHLCYEQSMDQKSRTAQDIEAASALIEILTNMANDLSSAIGEESLKERLESYQKELFKKTKKISKFRNAINALGKMIQEKINSINFVPYLIISHLGSVNSDSSKNYNWNEKWLEGATSGKIRGVVSNMGGAPAKEIRLSVMVNSELRGNFVIEEIVPRRKIPFTITYDKHDINENKVDWSGNVTYFDESNRKRLTSYAYGSVNVTVSDEEWGISHIGREKFNTQFAAEGDEFCGRTNELLRLNNLYNASMPTSRYPSLLVTGLRRAGKSSVIKYFKETLRQRGNLVPIFVDAQGINGDITNAFFSLVFNELYRYYRKEMDGFVDFKNRWTEISKTRDWIGQLPTYFMELSELLGNRKVIFILDEMENVFYANHFTSPQNEEQFFGMIRSIIQNYQEYVSFIFCGSDKLLTSCLEQKRESQMFQVLQRIYVGRMGINDIRDMFNKYNDAYDIKFGDDAIDAIMYYTNGLIWYTKVIAYNILDRIVDKEHIVRDEIHVSDVDEIVELLISGDLGSELIDLLDNNFGAKRKAIIRAMARATKNPNESATIDMIAAELTRLNYIDSETGEVLGALTEEDITRNLSVLEKMDFIEKDSHRERAYKFTTELYRLLMLKDRRIDKFVVKTGGESDG